jgi:hypothetical protein
MNTDENDYARHQYFIEGTVTRPKANAREGLASTIARGFRDIDWTLRNGGRFGHLLFCSDGDGWYSVTVTDGPFKGRSGIYQKGAPCCLFDFQKERTVEIAIH